MIRRFSLAICMAAALVPAAAAAADAPLPKLVAAYTDALVRQCGGASADAADQLLLRIDLNGDKLDDWVIDNSRYPCPTRPKVFANLGVPVTIFLAQADGTAFPMLQRAGFGARIEGKPETGYTLWVTVGGSDCGADDPKVRCDRRAAWFPKEQRIELVAAPSKLAGK